MSSDRSKILVVSRDPRLAAVRKSVLEAAGFQVVPASDDAAVRKFCRKHKPKLVMIGYSVAPAQKRRVWHEARRVL